MNQRQYPYIGKNTISGTYVYFAAPTLGMLVKNGTVMTTEKPIGMITDKWVEHQFEPVSQEEGLPILMEVLPIIEQTMREVIGDREYERLDSKLPLRHLVRNVSFHGQEEATYQPKGEEETMATKRAIKKGDLIIGSVHKTTGLVSISDKPVPHTNFMSAQLEGERLAKEFPQKKFVVLEVKGIVSVPTPGATWE